MAIMRMNLHYFALLYGIAFTLVGLAGFATHGMEQHQALLFGVFPINAIHSMAHLLIGAVGIGVFFASPEVALYYARTVGVVYVLLGVIGLFEPDLFGLMPIGGPDVALHLAAGALALYYGFAARLIVSRRPLSHM